MTTAYVVFVALRWARRGEPPGLASATATGALAALLLSLLLTHDGEGGQPAWRRRRWPPRLLLALLAGTMAGNLVLLFRRLTAEGRLPVVPAAATFGLGYVMRRVLRDLLNDTDRGDRR
jgi:hypothetical protein